MRRVLTALIARAVLLPIYLGTLLAVCLFGRRPGRRPRGANGTNGDGLTVALVVKFFNANWCSAHLTPIARAKNVRKVIAVVDGPTVPIPRVEYVTPSPAMRRVFGRILAKLILLFSVVWRERADVVIGYTLVPNGMGALIVARLLGRYAIYQNTVGPEEIVGGGAQTDTPLHALGWNSKVLEHIAAAVVRRFDAVVVRGQEAVEYLRSRKLTPLPCVLVGSVDCTRFTPGNHERTYDLITVSRLAEVKQLHHFLAIVKELKGHVAQVSGAIVGNGPLEEELKNQAAVLGVHDDVRFLGQTDNVESLLQRSRVFVLTSRSEGLSIALAEAMACGLPAVVSDVGELGQLVHNGVTGWRVPPGDIAAFSQRVLGLLQSPELWDHCSAAARRLAVECNGLDSLAARWATFLDKVTLQNAAKVDALR
jgi:glycosyltransferase involved in cell wall biosynthesis